mmetsp:Transcript_25778/g.84852  ORF Transcript_25778/g.84852 Transcript_25778/m.84852 type:complete len:286 (+) Transcript_25778:39-896(+)
MSSDLHLSEVHIGAPAGGKSVFTVLLPRAGAADSDEESDDEDMRVPRRYGVSVVISHAMETNLETVGLQVWGAELILVDYLASSEGRTRIQDETVVVLGSGCGLAAIVGGLGGAQRVFATDIADVLGAMHQNVSRAEVADRVRVRLWDWREAPPFSAEAAHGGEFGWSASDLTELQSATRLFAADVTYCPETTDAFFSAVQSAFASLSCLQELILAVELRYNFALGDTEARSHSFDYAKEFFTRHGRLLHGRRLSTNFPEAVILDPQPHPQPRSNMELWSIVRTA